MSGIAGANLPGRFRRWSRNVEGYAGARTRALDLYCGNAWSVVRRISASGDLGPKVRLWIVSAGLGLVTPQTMVPPYSATFAVGEPDSVVRDGDQEDVLAWWRLLVAWRKSKVSGVGSIADIARRHPREPLIAALSDDYLSALREDLAKARGLLDNAASLVIISAGARKDGELAKNFLPCDSRLEHRFGRSRMALNARVLEAFLNQHLRDGRTIGSVREHYADLLGSLPPASYPVRERGSDDRVRSFIRTRLAKDPGGRHTSLLRLYRGQGLACEQSRFRKLFRDVAAAVLVRKDRRPL
jgi:hypothetical protein